MCDFSIDFADFPQDDFVSERRALTAFVDDGLVAFEGTRLVVSDRGRPFVRAVCAVFDRYLETNATRHSRAI
jgi:oxygen-independent coproporphyrinogen-3 oxidase